VCMLVMYNAAKMLGAITFLPLIFAGLVACIGGARFVSLGRLRVISCCFSVVPLILTIVLCNNFNFALVDVLQFASKNNAFGVDGLSLVMLLLTNVTFPLAVLASCNSMHSRVKEYLVLLFCLQTFVVGTFVSVNIVLFYVFFEGSLIPMFLMIGIWGGKDKIYATMKFFLYTFFGSVFLLVAIIYLVSVCGSSSMHVLTESAGSLSLKVQVLLWLCFAVSFLVKLPSFPLHTWLPDAHVQAPTSASVILAAVLIKMGGYGFIRFNLPLFPLASQLFQAPMIILGIVSIIYGSLVAIKQTDIKKMVAYSSVAHMGYVTIGIFSLNKNGLDGAVFQMISHGLISGGLFLSVGVIYDRLHTRDFKDFGGIANKMPSFALLLMVLTMGSVGFPSTSGFVGEFMSVVSVFNVHPVYSILAGLGVVLGCVYMLLLYKNTMFGVITNSPVHYLKDINFTEKLYLSTICLLTIVIGVFPRLITQFL
jgi:NADH-quinone oxidoreductase subunit M